MQPPLVVQPKRDRFMTGANAVTLTVAIVALIVATMALTKEHSCSCAGATTAAASVVHNITAIDARVTELAETLRNVTEREWGGWLQRLLVFT